MITMQDHFHFMFYGKNSTSFIKPLIADLQVERISHLIKKISFLPTARSTLLETPVGDEQLHDDLSVYLSCNEWNYKNIAFPQAFISHPDWHKLISFANWLVEQDLNAARLKSGFWLEFDVRHEADAVPVPGLFFGIKTATIEPEEVLASIQAALAAIQITLTVPQKKLLMHSLEHLLPQCTALNIGIWLGRKDAPIHICAYGIALNKVADLLQEMGITTFADQSVALQQALELLVTNQLGVCFDIGQQMGTKIGLEIFTNPNQSLREQQQDDFLSNFLQWLLKNDWCLPDKVLAIKQWIGGERYFLNLQQQLIGGQLVTRSVNHIKLDFDENCLPRAKAYLRQCIIK
jgi:hypothetical protein